MAAAGGATDLRLNVPLSPARSTIKFSLTAALRRPELAGTLSGQSQTTWTWVSTHESGGHLPVGWFCPDLEPSLPSRAAPDPRLLDPRPVRARPDQPRPAS